MYKSDKNFGERVDYSLLRKVEESGLEKKIEMANRACELLWRDLSTSGDLTDSQKRIGEEWIKRLLASPFDIAYTDPDNPYFGIRERKVLAPADDIYSQEVADLVKKLNSAGIEAEIADIEGINQKIEDLEKRPQTSTSATQKARDILRENLEVLKHNVVLRDQIEMSAGEKEILRKANVKA